MFSTISIQDLSDQKRDKLRGRKSGKILRTVVLFMLLWSMVYGLWFMVWPFFFQAVWWTYIGTVAVGIWIAATVVQPENVANAKLAFKRWSLWVMTLIRCRSSIAYARGL